MSPPLSPSSPFSAGERVGAAGAEDELRALPQFRKRMSGRRVRARMPKNTLSTILRIGHPQWYTYVVQ